jgi:hypothetical protein
MTQIIAFDGAVITIQRVRQQASSATRVSMAIGFSPLVAR